MEDPRSAHAESCTVSRCIEAVPSRLHAQKCDRHIFREGIEHSAGIASASDACDYDIRKLTTELLQLLFCFGADYTLELNMSEKIT